VEGGGGVIRLGEQGGNCRLDYEVDGVLALRVFECQAMQSGASFSISNQFLPANIPKTNSENS
jgi:hypothetical protein